MPTLWVGRVYAIRAVSVNPLWVQLWLLYPRPSAPAFRTHVEAIVRSSDAPPGLFCAPPARAGVRSRGPVYGRSLRKWPRHAPARKACAFASRADFSYYRQAPYRLARRPGAGSRSLALQSRPLAQSIWLSFSPAAFGRPSATVPCLRHAGRLDGGALPPMRRKPDVLAGRRQPLAQQTSAADFAGELRNPRPLLHSLRGEPADHDQPQRL